VMSATAAAMPMISRLIAMNYYRSSERCYICTVGVPNK